MLPDNRHNGNDTSRDEDSDGEDPDRIRPGEKDTPQDSTGSAGLSRRRVLAGFGAAGVTLAAGCTGIVGSDDTEAVRVSLADEPVDGDWDAYGGVTPYYTPFLETLTVSPPDIQTVEPGLATDWEALDDTTWLLTLREGVTFHDGSEFTADIAADGLSTVVEARAPGFTRLTPDSFQPVDDHELEIETTQPEPATPGNLAHPLLSLPHPDEDNPVGTGPYVADEVTTDEIPASPFEDYWGENADVDLVFEGVVDPQTRSLRLESGETDVAIDLPRGNYDELADEDDITVRTETEPRTGMVMINKYRELTSDRNLRRALLHAIDQQAIVEELLDGIGEPAHSPFSKTIPWSAHDELPAHTDVDQAEEYLAASEYDGEELRFVISDAAPEHRLIAEEMQRRYDDVGINVAIEQVEPAAFFSSYRAGETDLAFVELGSINGAADYLVFVMFHSEGGDNVGQYESEGTGVVNPGEEVDALIEEGDMAFDETGKHEAYRQVQHEVMDAAVTIPIFYKDYVLATNADVEGPSLHAIPHMTDWTTVSR